MRLLRVYENLLKQYGKQNWWPAHNHKSAYMRKWEVCVGAILTQNTNWSNVEKALNNLISTNCLSAEKIAKISDKKLEGLIKPSGFYRQKAKRLKTLSNHVLKNHGSVNNFLKNATREELLAINGIGPETADSILLYACGKLHFVVDAYTRRIFSRLGIIDEGMKYNDIKSFFESDIPKNTAIYNEFHALIVIHAKQRCRKKPACEGCVIVGKCGHCSKIYKRKGCIL